MPENQSPATGPTALLVASFDSQLKWATGVRLALQRRGVRCRMVAPTDVRSSLSPQQIADYGGTGQVDFLSWEGLLEQALTVDVVVLVMQGSFVARFGHDLHQRLAGSDSPGPITVSGWVGVVLREITAGFLDRCATDVVAVNSRSDLRVFTSICQQLGLPTDQLVLSGLPVLAGGYTAPPATPTVRRVMYADQPTMPSGRREREYVYQRLVDYARRHPERTVLLKPRHRPGEDTIHTMKYHPETLLAELGSRQELPPNLQVDYTPIVDQLPTLDLMLTVSSTAALESVAAGVPTAFVADLGVREALGNHIFLGSGLLRTFDQVERDDLGTPDPDWVDDYFFHRSDDLPTPADAVAARVLHLLESDAPRPGAAVRASAYYASQHELVQYRARSAAAPSTGVPAAPDGPTAASAAGAAGRSTRSPRGGAGLRRRARLLGQALQPPVGVQRRLRSLATRAGAR